MSPLSLAFLFALGGAAGEFELPPSFGEPQDGEVVSVQAPVSAEDCAVAHAVADFFGKRDFETDQVPRIQPSELQVVPKQLPAGTASCSWGAFATRSFTAAPFIDAIGFDENERFATVQGAFAYQSPHTGFGSCLLLREYGSWKVAGCDLSKVRF